MNPAYVNSQDFSFFCDTTQQLNSMIEYLGSDTPLNDEHGAVEQYIRDEGHELLRRLLQGHLDLRASQESRQADVVNRQEERLYR